MNRRNTVLKIFNSKFINFKEDASDYVKNKNLDKINNNFSNENINDILYGLNKFYVNDYKYKNIYEVYRIMCNDFIKNNEKINFSCNNVFLSLIKNLSILDKGYILLNYLNTKYNLGDYSEMVLKTVLLKGTLTNLLFWKKFLPNNNQFTIFTIENLIIVCKNSDFRMLKYFVDNNNYNYNLNEVNITKILNTITLSIYIPPKFKLRRIKLLNKIINFNNYLDIMLTKLPLYMIIKMHNFYNFIEYKLSVQDMNYLTINNTEMLIKFYNLTNNYNKSIIELLLIFYGETNFNYKYVLTNNNLQDYLGNLFCHFSSLNNPFFDFNSENFNKKNYELILKIMNNNFNKNNYIINVSNYWDSKIIIDYCYFLIPFIKRIYVYNLHNVDIDKNYLVLRRFFIRTYNKRIKYNRYMELFNKNTNKDIIINNNINNIIIDKSILKNKTGYISYYFEGIKTNKLPPNIINNINNIDAIYLEDESLYLVFDCDNLTEKHEYLVKNNIKLNLDNYHQVLKDYINNNINSNNKWFPLIFEKLPIIINNNHQYIFVKDLSNNINNIIVKNKENIYIKLKIIVNNNLNLLNLIDYDNNNYNHLDIYDKLKDKITQNVELDNTIIKYYPYKKDYEICYYSIRPNKKDKIDYLLNL